MFKKNCIIIIINIIRFQRNNWTLRNDNISAVQEYAVRSVRIFLPLATTPI